MVVFFLNFINGEEVDGVLKVICSVLEMNEEVFVCLVKDNYFVKIFLVIEVVKNVWVNGWYGLKDFIKLVDW